MATATKDVKSRDRKAGSGWSLGELAERLRVSETTIKKAIRERRLKTFRVGRRVLVTDAERARVEEEGL